MMNLSTRGTEIFSVAVAEECSGVLLSEPLTNPGDVLAKARGN